MSEIRTICSDFRRFSLFEGIWYRTEGACPKSEHVRISAFHCIFFFFFFSWHPLLGMHLSFIIFHLNSYTRIIIIFAWLGFCSFPIHLRSASFSQYTATAWISIHQQSPISPILRRVPVALQSPRQLFCVEVVKWRVSSIPRSLPHSWFSLRLRARACAGLSRSRIHPCIILCAIN